MFLQEHKIGTFSTFANLPWLIVAESKAGMVLWYTVFLGWFYTTEISRGNTTQARLYWFALAFRQSTSSQHEVYCSLKEQIPSICSQLTF